MYKQIKYLLKLLPHHEFDNGLTCYFNALSYYPGYEDLSRANLSDER